MWGFITNRAHKAAGRVWADELVTLTTARDALAVQVDEQNRRIVSLEAELRAKNNRITNMQKDIDRMEAEANANARFVEVGKKRLAALDRQNRYAKALRKARRDQAAADLPPCVDVMPSDRKAKGRASA